MVEFDIFTFSAQIANFLILIFLLRHFLYGRITGAMDERERRIASRLEEAEKKKKEAGEEEESYRKKEQELQDKREEMLASARKDAEAVRDDLIRKARDEVNEVKAGWYQAVKREKSSFLSDLRRRAGEQVCATARRALEDLASEELERHIINTFVRRLQYMEEDEKKAVSDLGNSPEQAVVVKSAFEIPEEMRQRIREAVQDKTGREVGMQFGTSPGLICGIELLAQDRRIAWSLDSYLDTIEEDIAGALEQKVAEDGERKREG